MKATWVTELIHRHLLFQSLLRGLPTALLSPSYPDCRQDAMESKDLPEKFVRKNLNTLKIVGTFYTNACGRSFWTLKEPHLLIHSFVRSFVRSSIHPSIHPSIHSILHLFIHAFLHSFTQCIYSNSLWNISNNINKIKLFETFLPV